MSNIYDMSGKKKVIFQDNIKDITYKEIMTIIIQHATEEGCHEIFTYGGVNMCPSDVFKEKVDKKQEEYECNYKSIGCTNCWSKAIKKLKEDKQCHTMNK